MYSISAHFRGKELIFLEILKMILETKAYQKPTMLGTVLKLQSTTSYNFTARLV